MSNYTTREEQLKLLKDTRRLLDWNILPREDIFTDKKLLELWHKFNTVIEQLEQLDEMLERME